MVKKKKKTTKKINVYGNVSCMATCKQNCHESDQHDNVAVSATYFVQFCSVCSILLTTVRVILDLLALPALLVKMDLRV